MIRKTLFKKEELLRVGAGVAAGKRGQAELQIQQGQVEIGTQGTGWGQ